MKTIHNRANKVTNPTHFDSFDASGAVAESVWPCANRDGQLHAIGDNSRQFFGLITLNAVAGSSNHHDFRIRITAL